MLRLGLLTIIGFLNFQASVAQGEFSIWTRATLGYRIDSKHLLDAELQYRRQNLEAQQLVWDKPLLQSLRFWVHQDLNKNWQVSLSPFAYLDHSQLNSQAEDAVVYSKEIRFSAAVLGKETIWDKWQVIHRTALESRHLINNKHYALRARHRVGLKYTIDPAVAVQFSEELLINPMGKTGPNLIDHNRWSASLDLRLNNKFKSELGYMVINRYKPKADLFQREQVVMFNVYYRLK